MERSSRRLSKSNWVRREGFCFQSITNNSNSKTGYLLTQHDLYTTTVCQILSTQQSLNPWNYKPWWCQPWSILLTGTIIIAGSWIILNTIWVTVLVSLPILVWWTYFLWFWPRLIKNSGILETYQQSAQDSMSQVRD